MAAKAPKCSCNLGYLIVGIVLAALGLWMLASAFIGQLQGMMAQAVLPWWLGGVVLVMLAKMAKWKSCGMCMAHKM